MALSKTEGRRCLRSLLLAAYYSIRLSRRFSALPLLAGFREAQLAGNTLLVIRNPRKSAALEEMKLELDGGFGLNRGHCGY